MTFRATINPLEHLTCRTRLVGQLRDEQNAAGLWDGHLSSSALATAVSAFALKRMDPKKHRHNVSRALHWLCVNANADGAWGDTPESPANLSTTLLCWSALALAEQSDTRLLQAADRAAAWIAVRIGGNVDAAPMPCPRRIAAVLCRHYGQDRTFSTPILAMCAMAGRLGPADQAWRLVPQLPFELAAFPSRWYRKLRLPMVSYALPALIAIGWVRHRHRRSLIPGLANLRDRLAPRLLDTLTGIQPAGGGFLEAAPLTAFVTMSLCAAGASSHPVARRAADFLLRTMRHDGSWPIDTNLKTWVTTQAVQALGEGGVARAASLLGADAAFGIRNWLLRIQYRRTHPYTGAPSGGWAWTDLPGGVPDADDTAGALVALRMLTEPSDASWSEVRSAAADGLRWLLDLQNRDGGLPTFCRGWGRLPFDRSCPDITAHALRAMLGWSDICFEITPRRFQRAIARAVRYLFRNQNADGSWTPLWFGNELAPDAENRTYGTARVVVALRQALQQRNFSARDAKTDVSVMLERGERWLLDHQNDDGGWGAARGVPSSAEETGLAVQALAGLDLTGILAVEQGLRWLADRLADRAQLSPAPIGLYFASLWYWERLYPTIFALGAFSAAEKTNAKP